MGGMEGLLQSLAHDRAPYVSSLLCQTEHPVLVGRDPAGKDSLHYPEFGHRSKDVLAQLNSFSFVYGN